MTARRRRVLLLLLTSMFLAFAGSLPGGARYLIPAADLTPIDRPGPEIPIISTLAPNPTPAGVPTQPPVFTVVPNFPLPTIPQISTLAPIPTAISNDPNQPNPNIPQPDVPTPTLTPIFPVETVEPYIPSRVTPPVIPRIPSDDTPDLDLAPASITIRTRVCDNEGFDPYFVNVSSSPLTELQALYDAECPATTVPFGFSMYYPGMALSKVTAAGIVTFTVPAMTTVKVEDANPEGYDASMSICSSGAWEGHHIDFAEFPQGWGTSPGEKIECTWYFVRNGDDINLILYKLTCSGFDPATLTEDTAGCGTDRTRGEFGTVTLSDLDPTTPDIVQPAGSDKIVLLDIPAGTYTVTETGVAAGTSWTYWSSCTIYDSLMSKGAIVKSSTLTIDLTPGGDTYVCGSFNVLPIGSTPEVASSDPVAALAPANGHVVRTRGTARDRR